MTTTTRNTLKQHLLHSLDSLELYELSNWIRTEYQISLIVERNILCFTILKYLADWTRENGQHYPFQALERSDLLERDLDAKDKIHRAIDASRKSLGSWIALIPADEALLQIGRIFTPGRSLKPDQLDSLRRYTPRPVPIEAEVIWYYCGLQIIRELPSSFKWAPADATGTEKEYFHRQMGTLAKILIDSGHSISDIACSLAVTRQTLDRWLQAASF